AGNMPIGALQAFIQYLMIVLMGFMMAAMMSVRLPRASVSSGRLLEVIDDKSSISCPENPYRPKEVKGEIEFKDVSFSYPSSDKHASVEHISFKANVGETTAFIGATGSGKSTILSLAQRIYDPDEGEVLLDGHSLKEFDPSYLSTLFAPVFQTAKLFTGTIRSNMLFGKEDATDEEIWKALEIAQAKDFVESFGEGLDYKVSEGGTNFSGGQKQRLCIARAILRGAPVYAFDDAFSALDMATDKKLREALEPVTENSSMLLVAQRFSSIMAAEKIIVLERGRIVGEGNHKYLMENCETYEQIVASQSGTIQG
ncbi:MAG: ABC transporter ATP-binding protein, partial [Bifidobacteriaceae bacterium]|nr:ABC transporter ATP-binding protein [Bifidobacteriaceae bacterium]